MRFRIVKFLLAIAVYCLLLSGCCNKPRNARTEIIKSISSLTIEDRRPLTASFNELAILTWNVRGYPEKEPSRTTWLHQQITATGAQVVCVQEIPNTKSVKTFTTNDSRFVQVAFKDSSDGMDNAIFTTSAVAMEDVSDPEGFQHPVQCAYVACGGFDATVVCVHLSWTDTAMREREKTALKTVVSTALQKDPDVIIVGDFNTTEAGITSLAHELGMVVMVPPGQDGVGTTHANNRYDHFLISPDLAQEEAICAKIIQFSGTELEIAKKCSDHLPVMARFKTNIEFKDRR